MTGWKLERWKDLPYQDWWGRWRVRKATAGGGTIWRHKGTEEGSAPAAESRVNPKWEEGGSCKALQAAWKTGSELKWEVSEMSEGI